MKKLLTASALAVAVVTAGFGVTTLRGTASADHPADIVGVWEVTADAPYPAHLFTFNKDGTMLSTNPTNVQENPAKPHGGTNDSVGMGAWRVQNIDGDKYVVGTFEELNANADDHTATDTLSVTFKVQLSNDETTFEGPATVDLGSITGIPSHLKGDKRIIVNQAEVDTL